MRERGSVTPTDCSVTNLSHSVIISLHSPELQVSIQVKAMNIFVSKK